MRGRKAVIPFRSHEKVSQDKRQKLDTLLYKKRTAVECCFANLKEYRRIATRSEKTARNSFNMLKLGAIWLFLKLLSN
ncbi:transposase [Chania multitudinisentens RB-25]|uniref:Transposase n=2 Tax=Chania TaxID=1745211 RepID=A0A0D4ZY67_9GAMM|nr:transposase [Chania multitudinisentens RB-25]